MQKQLIQWYQQNKRGFPWRKDQDPYHIWISEIMLQQTTTETVIPYYIHFLEVFPTIEKLANASLEEVYKMWEGLGYYRRAKHLHESAQIIVDKYDGQFPREYDEILALKGIGSYTAGAISSIAYGKPVPAVDGNVLRIMSRYYLIKENIVELKIQKQIFKIVQELIQGHDASAFNQGLMDLGATICRPVHPQCSICPIQKKCQAYRYNQQEVLPISIKKIKKQEIGFITGIITYQNKFLLIQNPPGGLLENLYGFIQYDVESPYSFITSFQENYQQELKIHSYIKDIKHVFTHRTWFMHVYHFTLNHEIKGMYTLEEIQSLPLSTAHLKVLKAYLKFM
nr:A/G-specific adenine glycosylase [uncultured Faecalibacillus sp.]